MSNVSHLITLGIGPPVTGSITELLTGGLQIGAVLIPAPTTVGIELRAPNAVLDIRAPKLNLEIRAIEG